MRGSPRFNHNRCTGCGACSNICPTQAIEIIDDQQNNLRKIELWLGACIFCGYCRDICPEGAIELLNEPVPPSPHKKIFEEVEVELAICEVCGKAFSSASLYRKINIPKGRDFQPKDKFQTICEKCRRLSYAKIYARTM